MNEYEAPVERMMLALRTAGLDQVLDLAHFDSIDEDAVHDVLAGFGRLASDVIAPTDRIGDIEGARLDPTSGRVIVPQPLVDAYAEFVKGGWIAVAAPQEFGGAGFPVPSPPRCKRCSARQTWRCH